MNPLNDPASRSVPDGAPIRPRLSVGKRILFTTIMLLICLAAAEVLCRVTGMGAAQPNAHYISEWHKMPDGRTFWVVRGPGHNDDGMRDRQHADEKPAGVFRLVCLGDSVTLGHGVPPESSYPSILETTLSAAGMPAEVFNIAASGWATHQQLTAYQAIVRKYSPDQVILGFCLNDVAEMQNNLRAPPSPIMGAAARHSALARALVNAQTREIRDVESLMVSPEPPAVREGWERVFADLSALHDEVRRDGAEFWVMVFPFRFQLSDGSPPPLAQERLRAFCAERKIPFLDLLPELRPLGPEALIDESHLSPAGARAVAEAVVRWGRGG